MSQDAYHKIHIPPAVKPSGCPIDHDFTPFNADYLQNPYPQLEALLDNQPVFYAEQLGYLVLTRLEDVVEVFKNPELFSSENVQDPVFPVCEAARDILSAEDYNPQAVMSNCQQPDHTRIRRYTRDGFNARRMKILEPYIREGCETLIDDMLAKLVNTDVIVRKNELGPEDLLIRLDRASENRKAGRRAQTGVKDKYGPQNCRPL